MKKIFKNLKASFGFLFILKVLVDAESLVDFTQHRISLLPDHYNYVRSVNGGHMITCIGRPGDDLIWSAPNGNDVDKTGRVHYEKVEHQLRLVIESVKKDDGGEWTCRLEYEDEVKKSFYLDVYVPITFENVDDTLKIKEGEDVTIRCEVTGQPLPKVDWLFNGIPLKENLNDDGRFKAIEDGLYIKKVKREDSGEYTCRAMQFTAIDTIREEQTVLLNVQYKPIIKGHRHHDMYGFPNGEVKLRCEADAEPPADFSWYREDGKKIAKNVHSGDNFSELHLFINASHSFGDYKCRARNTFGQEDKIIKLAEGKKPPSPSHVALRGLSSDTFDIDVGAKVDPKTHNKMSVNGYRFELIPEPIFNEAKSWNKSFVREFAIADGVTYLLSPLSPDTNYMVRVAAHNVAGYSEWSQTERFKTLAKQLYITSASVKIYACIMSIVGAFTAHSIVSCQFKRV